MSAALIVIALLVAVCLVFTWIISPARKKRGCVCGKGCGWNPARAK